MKIITHPDNLAMIRGMLDDFGGSGRPLCGVEVVTNSHMDPKKWSGKYVLPNGKVVEEKNIVVPDGRFFEWTASDKWYLLSRDIIRKHMEPLFFEVNDKPFLDMLTAPVLHPLMFSPF